MTKKTSALIIGGGHNGLICATYLAKAGMAVTLFEANETVGGGLAGRQLKNGVIVPALAHHHRPLNTKIIKELGLPRGAYATTRPSQSVFLNQDGPHLTVSGDCVEGGGLSDQDIEEYRAFRAEYLGYAKALKPLMLNTPPRLKGMDWTDKKTLGKLGLGLRFGLGRDSLREFLRIVGMNVFDVLEERFDSEVLKGGIAADSIMGSHAGPKTPTTVLAMLMRLFQETGESSGHQSDNTGNLCDTLEGAARKAGVTIRTSAAVKSILIKENTSQGVLLENDERIEADIVVSGVDAKSTFLKLVGIEHLDAMFVHRISKTRTNGNVARYTLLLRDLPVFKGLKSDCLGKRIVIAPTMRYVERAFNASKYGECSEQPVLEVIVKSIETDTPSDQYIMSINASFAPYNLKQGWLEGNDAFTENILKVLHEYAPGIKELIAASDFLSPRDVEQQYGVTGGHWHHGEMTIDQGFMMRPVHGTAQYNTPLPGLFLCGAAAHPGGDITGLPGRNAAQRIIAMQRGM